MNDRFTDIKEPRISSILIRGFISIGSKLRVANNQLLSHPLLG